MKPEQAIENLKDINTVARTRQMCRSIDGELEDGETQVYKDRFQAVNMAIEAVKRQIPTKVRGISVTHEGYVGNCPLCGNFITYLENKRFCNKDDCGQALKWEDQ